jgi:hypothetical protein
VKGLVFSNGYSRSLATAVRPTRPAFPAMLSPKLRESRVVRMISKNRGVTVTPNPSRHRPRACSPLELRENNRPPEPRGWSAASHQGEMRWRTFGKILSARRVLGHATAPGGAARKPAGNRGGQMARRTAIDFYDRAFSFREINDLAARAAKGLQTPGVGPGVHVALHLPNTPHFVINFFAVLLATTKTRVYRHSRRRCPGRYRWIRVARKAPRPYWSIDSCQERNSSTVSV